MQKCFYHAKSDAVTTCLGCKMPVCGPCRDAGNKGFCEACLKKVSALGEQIKDAKKTGVLQGTHKATMIKTVGRPTSQKNVTYCFQHFDVIATGNCPTCNRAFCAECLDASGMCSHCARLAEPEPDARKPAAGAARPPRPAGERARAEARPRPAAAAKAKESGGLMQPATFFVVAVVVLLLAMAVKMLG